jgi:hypothetical protein
VVKVGDAVTLGPVRGILTLDGERHLPLREQRVTLKLEADGPRVVDVAATLAEAMRRGAFRVDQPHSTC